MGTMYYIGLDVQQEDHQLLREGREWPRLRGRLSPGRTF